VAAVASSWRERSSATDGTCSTGDLALRGPFDVAQQAQLAWLGEGDGDALAAGPADRADAVDVGVGRDGTS
jgi:hypothetical protein